ncbi:hypothetical protein Glove_140g153 [Diversispora epigaea]|uniref:Uncharacterized protein n=1 Tax=Diversispora epigaea TaxID=1348612 RepID=A0A397J4U2_9GLOM|nr:hypothetical protein Glove_140g153 [Diversispora epigaea]
MSKILSCVNRYYSNSYRSRPLITLAITNGILASISDILAQSISLLRSSPNNNNNFENHLKNDSSHPLKHGEDIKKTALDNSSFNFMQVGRFGLYGFMIAPVIHNWYSFLDKRFPLPAGVSTGISAATEVSSSIKHINTNEFLIKLKRMNLQSMNAVIKRVALDQIMFAPVGIGLFFILIGALEGRNFNGIEEKLDEAYLPALKANYTVWPLVQIINFRFLPLKYRVPFVSSIGVLWTCYLSLLNSEIVK